MIYGDYSRPAPQAEIVRAVAAGEVDVAFVWGPVAGYFVRRQKVPLRLTPLPPIDPKADSPMAFAVAMGVRRDDTELKARLERSLERRGPEIRRLLAGYGVPMVAPVPRPAEDDD